MQKKQSVQQTFEKPIKALIGDLPFGSFLTKAQQQQYASQWSRYIQKQLIKTAKAHIGASGLAHSVFVELYDLNFVAKGRQTVRSQLLQDFLPPVVTAEADRYDLMINASLNESTRTILNAVQKSIRLMQPTDRKKIFKQLKAIRHQDKNINEMALLLHEKLTGLHAQMPSDMSGKMDFLLKYPFAMHVETDNREMKLSDRLTNVAKILCYLLEDDFRAFGAVVCRQDTREDMKNRAMRAHRILMNDVPNKEYNAEDLINKVLVRPNEITDLNDKQIDIILGPVEPVKLQNQTKKALKRVCYRLRDAKENS